MSLVLYQVHKHTPIFNNLKDTTLFQYHWLNYMAVEEVNYRNSIETILTGIAKGVGVEIKNNTQSNRKTNDFKERIKQRQNKNKKRR